MRRYYSSAEAADTLGISKVYLWKITNKKKIKIKKNGHFAYTDKDIQDLFETLSKPKRSELPRKQESLLHV
jgi:hypothetical protein